MTIIRLYTNTKHELQIASTKLNALMFRKEKIYTKYFPQTAQYSQTKNSGNEQKDKMVSYMYELTKKNKITGMSLDEEIEETRNIKNELEYYIRLMDYELKELKGIEYELFHSIVVKGIPITKAVSMIAEEYNKDIDTIWKFNYSKIKKYIKILRKKQNV